MQRQPASHPGPASTFKRSTRAPWGTPRSDSSRPLLTPGKRKSRKWGSEAASRGPPPGPNPREGGYGPRQGLPGVRGPRRRRARPRLKGQRLPGPGRRGRLRKEARGPVLSEPPPSSRRALSASLRATGSRCSPLAATPCQQPNAPEVESTRRPLSPRPAAALEPDQSGIK